MPRQIAALRQHLEQQPKFYVDQARKCCVRETAKNLNNLLTKTPDHGLQAVHMSREAHREKTMSLGSSTGSLSSLGSSGSLGRALPAHLVETPGRSFTALLNRCSP